MLFMIQKIVELLGCAAAAVCAQIKMAIRNVSKTFRGYDYEFCDPLPDECPCPVCTLVQKEPYQLTCCGKIFCKSCLDQLIAKRSSCPNCHADFIKKKKYFPDVNTKRRINHFRIFCSNKNNGCEWVGHLKDLKEQHIPECPNEVVPCTNVEIIPNYKETIFGMWTMGGSVCSEKIQRHQLEKHMDEECPLRTINCVHCNARGSFYLVNGDHIKKNCPTFLLTCENEGCLLKVKRYEMNDHHRSCPKKVIDCPQYSLLGCKAKIKREEIQSHEKEAMQHHLDLTADALRRALVRIEAMEAKLK